MSLVVLLVAALAAANPLRALAALPDDGRAERRIVALLGAVTALVGAGVAAALAGPISDGLDIAPPTIRMAAGAVLAAQGIATALLPLPKPEPRMAGRRAALVPVAFPTLLTPALALLGVSGSLDRSAPVAVGVLAVALATLPLLAVAVPAVDGAGGRLQRGIGALVAAALVACGIGLVFDGIFDI